MAEHLQVTVRISPALRRLRRGVDAPAPVDRSDDSACVPTQRRAECGRLAPPPACVPLRLRRDGRRPVVFRGVPLALFAEDPTDVPAEAARLGAGPQAVALFLADDGRVFGQTRLEVSGEGVARPIYAAAEIAARGDLDRLLDDHRPERALPSDGTRSAAPEEAIAVARHALRAGFARLTAPLRSPNRKD